MLCNRNTVYFIHNILWIDSTTYFLGGKMNHLEIAKEYVGKLLEHEEGSVPPELAQSAGMFITANALIAIAEQLKKANKVLYLLVELDTELFNMFGKEDK
jgi:hypothetical protein